MTKARKYYFQVRYDEKSPHQFVEVKRGQINHVMKNLISTKDYKILEGKSSLLIINKKTRALNVNDRSILKKGYFSKGTPLFINKVRIL